MAANPDAEILVRYRMVGGPTSVDQRLTVHSSGFVVLEERHRSRGPTELRVSSNELDQIRSALDQIPAERWSSGSGLSSLRAKSQLKSLLRPWVDDLPYFEVKAAGRTIAGLTDEERAAEAAVTLLDNLRVHAIQTAETLNPT